MGTDVRFCARSVIWFGGGINLISLTNEANKLFSYLWLKKWRSQFCRVGLNAFGAWRLMAEGPWPARASGEIVKERGRIRAERLAASAGAFQDSVGYPVT
jgi:hypothetical protein